MPDSPDPFAVLGPARVPAARARRNRAARRRAEASRRRRIALTVAVLLVVGAVGSIGSWAAWTVSISNPNNTFTTGTVLLEDTQGAKAGSTTASGSAVFTVTDLSPGATVTRCIGVNFSGSTATGMTLAGALGGADQATLQGVLTMDVARYNTSGTVTIGQGGNSTCGNYPGGGSNVTIGTQGATLQTWTGAGPYAIASPVTNTWYQFTVGMPSGASNCNTYCNKTITLTLTWTLTTA